MDSKSIGASVMHDVNEVPESEVCPMCGGGMAYGGGISDPMSDLDMNAHNDALVGDARIANVEEGNEDQEKARKSRLDGVLDGLRKRHMSK